MRKFSTLSLLFLAITFLAVSCTKEGPEGPVGATGAQGVPGAPGAAGPAGPIGPGATYSAWFVTGNGWTTTADYAAEFIFRRTAPSITQPIIDQGVVLAYMKGDPTYEGTPQANTAYQLPYLVGPGFGWTDIYDFGVEGPGNIVFFYKSDFAWTAAELGVVSFRYITIPGTVAGRGVEKTYGGFTKEQLKNMSYDEVAAHFKIPAQGSNIQ